MFVGLDICQLHRKSIIGMAASANQQGTQYFSRLATQSIGKDLDGKSKQEQEAWICSNRSNQFEAFILDALQNYKIKNRG